MHPPDTKSLQVVRTASASQLRALMAQRGFQNIVDLGTAELRHAAISFSNCGRDSHQTSCLNSNSARAWRTSRLVTFSAAGSYRAAV